MCNHSWSSWFLKISNGYRWLERYCTICHEVETKDLQRIG